MDRRTVILNSVCSAVFLGAFPKTVHAASVNYVVSPLPTPVSQGNENLCWLAASAVMFSYRDKRPYTLTDAATKLGGAYVLKQTQGLALQYDELKTWLFSGGFASQGQQSLDAKGWEQLLKNHGPLITLVDGSGSGTINHAVVVLGVVGDGTQNGTNITFANGQSAQIEIQTLSKFMTIFELPSGSDVLFSVAYFK